MKRASILICILLALCLISVSAYDLGVESVSNEEIILSFSGLDSVDFDFGEITAKVEGSTFTDTYLIEPAFSTLGDDVLLSVDISEVYKDYSKDQVEAITVSGSLDGSDFAKRVFMRDATANLRLAPTGEDANIIYWILGIVLLLVLAVLLVILIKEPKKRKVVKKKVKRKKAKKKAKKKVKKKKKKVTKKKVKKTTKKKSKKKSSKKEAKKKKTKRKKRR
tara:strand:- start:105 stop:767 length:663 start_codon:yes stop_codon:yes gene_type:complete